MFEWLDTLQWGGSLTYMLRSTLKFLVFLWFVALIPTVSWAVTVYLNGIAITGVPNQTFKNCTVTTDASGNVYIDAPAYKVEGPVGRPATTPGAQVQAGLEPSQRYWLITERTPEMAEYDIDVFINGKWLRKFLNEEEQQVVEISKYFKTGSNKVALMARKRKQGADRNSSSPAHYFRIVIGAGKMNGRSIMVTESLVDYRRTAAEVDDRNDIFTVTIR